jgi:hypothetical protein
MARNTLNVIEELPAGRSSSRLLSSFQPDFPVVLSRGVWLVIALLIVLLLSPSLFFPLGPDEAMFFVGGQKLLRGDLYYRDIIDIKTPLICYLYAFAIWLFGAGDSAIRILDLLLQGATCWLIISLVRRASGNDIWAALAALCYAMIYVSQGFHNTAQTESYAGLLGMLMIRLLMFRRTTWGFIATGLLAGLLTVLKSTLGALGIAALLGELLLFRRSWRETARSMVLIIAGIAVVVLLFLLYLVATDTLDGFMQVQQFVQGYAGLAWGSSLEWFSEALKRLPSYFSTSYTMAFLLATVIAIVATMRAEPITSDTASTSPSLLLLRLCTFFFLALLVTAVAEGKYFVYQFSRIFAFGSVLVAYGTLTFLHNLAAGIRVSGYVRLLGLVAVVLGLFYSPLPRFLFQSVPMAYSLTGRHDAAAASYDRLSDAYPREELEAIGSAFNRERTPATRLFVASSVGALVYHFARYIPDFSIYHSAFIIAPFAPLEWKQSTAQFILTNPPDFIVLQVADSSYTLAGSPLTSEQAFLQLPVMDSLVAASYNRMMQTPNFALLRRTPY